MISRYLLVCSFSIGLLLSGSRQLHAQPWGDYYAPMNNMLTLADFSKRYPTRGICTVGNPSTKDPLDGYSILASASGAGVINFIWMTFDQPLADSADSIKLWIDDQLIYSGVGRGLARSIDGSLRPPMDQQTSGGFICNVQMPYKKSFRLTFWGDRLYWATVWRPLPDSLVPESFSRHPSPAFDAMQRNAEANYLDSASPWAKQNAFVLPANLTMTPGSAVDIASLKTSGFIHTLELQPDRVDSSLLDSLYLEMYWDGDPTAAVRAPIPDFFGISAGPRTIHSRPFRVDSNLLRCYFPMPFHSSARIRLVNTGTSTIHIRTRVLWDTLSVDRATTGYFRALYRESNRTKSGLWHPVAHCKGEGRFVGIQMTVRDFPNVSFMEGDARFRIDSNDQLGIEYTGTDDYFEGGWYFGPGPFTLPFAGTTSWLGNSLYRFNIFDAMEFRTSFDFDFQHGYSDINADYRTVAFLYTLPTPFWTNSDTIRQSYPLIVSGTGYKPGSTTNIALDGTSIGMQPIGADGSFSFVTTATSSWKPGVRLLSVDGVEKSICVVATPLLKIVRDSIPVRLRYNDPVYVTGFGFLPNEHISFMLDTTPVATESTFAVDSSFSFRGWIVVPWIDTGLHTLRAIGNQGTLATSAELLPITRTLVYEFETDMFPPLKEPGYTIRYADGISFYEGIVTFEVALNDSTSVWPFTVPVTDSFDVGLRFALGQRIASCEVLLDGAHIGSFDGYRPWAPWIFDSSGLQHFGTHVLSKGAHTIGIHCNGRDSAATDWLIGLDNLVLDGAGQFNPRARVARTPVDFGPSIPISYPNPLFGDARNITLDLSEIQGAIFCRSAKLFDALGRSVDITCSPDIDESEQLHVTVPCLPQGTYYLYCLIDTENAEHSVVRSIEIIR